MKKLLLLETQHKGEVDFNFVEMGESNGIDI